MRFQNHTRRLSRLLSGVCVLLMFVSLLSGCGFSGEDGQKHMDVNEEAIQYMEEKYGEPFEYSAPTGDSMTGIRAMLVRCNSLPDAVYVEIENYRSSDRVFRDNYLAVKYKQETIDFLTGCGLAEFDDINVYYDVVRDALSPDLPADADFETFLRDSEMKLYATLEVKQSEDYKKDVAEMVERVAASGVQYRFVIIVMAPEEFGLYDHETLSYNLVMDEHVKDYALASKTDDYTELEWPWTEAAAEESGVIY